MRLPEITERDTALLELLSKGCVLRADQVRLLFGTNHYHYERLGILEKRGLIIQKGRYIEIATKGMRAVGLDARGVQIRHDWQREHRARVADLYFALTGWDFRFALEYKREQKDIHRGACFDAVISRADQTYALYLLNQDIRKSTLATLKKDWVMLRDWNITGAIALCPSPDVMRAIDIPAKLDALLALPYPFGVTILNRLDHLYAQARPLFPGALEAGRPFADWRVGDTFITFLVTNDLVKRRLLADYVNHVRDREGRRNIVVCLQSQRERFAEMFLSVEIVTLPDPKPEVMAHCKDRQPGMLSEPCDHQAAFGAS